jgi:hypothetical protein
MKPKKQPEHISKPLKKIIPGELERQMKLIDPEDARKYLKNRNNQGQDPKPQPGPEPDKKDECSQDEFNSVFDKD